MIVSGQLTLHSPQINLISAKGLNCTHNSYKIGTVQKEVTIKVRVECKIVK